MDIQIEVHKTGGVLLYQADGETVKGFSLVDTKRKDLGYVAEKIISRYPEDAVYSIGELQEQYGVTFRPEEMMAQTLKNTHLRDVLKSLGAKVRDEGNFLENALTVPF